MGTEKTKIQMGVLSVLPTAMDVQQELNAQTAREAWISKIRLQTVLVKTDIISTIPISSVKNVLIDFPPVQMLDKEPVNWLIE